VPALVGVALAEENDERLETHSLRAHDATAPPDRRNEADLERLAAREELGALVGDMVRLDKLAEGKRGAAPLLDEVRKFQEASLRGEYYDSFDVNSKNCMQKSEGTENFIADFDKLMGLCVRAAAKSPRTQTREAFGLLFDILRRIDDSPDDVVFFADEAGSWQVGVDWRSVLPAYFRCLADVARRLGFTRARLTHLLDLLLLAPDVQVAVLSLEAIDGAEPMSERALGGGARREGAARGLDGARAGPDPRNTSRTQSNPSK
jgi:hypothetical protein